jgi:lipopolysaccharide export system protein LptC
MVVTPLYPSGPEPAPAKRSRRPLPAHVRRHSFMVATMRLALPVIAAGLLAALALWSKLGFDTERFVLAVTTGASQRIESMSMNNAHFEGIDDKKRPFTLTAKTATQLDATGDVIDLVQPQADMTMETGAWMTVSSDKGLYHRKAQLLDLGGEVNLFQDQGYEMHTHNMHVDLGKKTATGHEAVQGQGPSGDLTAEGIQVEDGGKRLLLLGRSHLVLFASDQSSAAIADPSSPAPPSSVPSLPAP